MFYTISKTDIIILASWNLSANAINLTKAKIVPFSERVNSLPNHKILDKTKLKAFADDKINVAQRMISDFDRLENIAGKGKNAGY